MSIGLESGCESSRRKKGKNMKPNSISHALFVLISCSILALVTVNCPMPMQGVSSSASATGSIAGKIMAPGQSDNSGVVVTAEPTDGIKSISVQKTLSSRQVSSVVVAAQATTNASGAYTLSGLSPGIYTLSAIGKDGLQKAVTTSVTVSAGSTAQALVMILTQTGQIQGVVTLGDFSNPLGVVVFIAGTSYSAMADAKGNYLMSYVPAGKNYTLVASKVGYDSAITGVDVNVNSTSTPRQNPLVLALHSTSHATGSVSGAATLKDAPSNAGIFVYLLGTSSICVTDTDGKFSLAGLAPGSYTIMASKEGYSAQSASVIIPSGPASPISFILTILGPYFVTYDSNGGTGNVPIDPTNYMEGFRVTVLGNSGNLMNPGFSFDGWNTQADGKGISYTQGQTFVMGSSHVVLYATWALAATEYFISFKYDGTQVRFTHGVLEWGDVPLAGVEVGWQHDGHVYDRTHILAIPVGLPMTNFPGDTSIEIVLAGEPGTQPPPAGTYTFSDGVHMIHDITYAAPGIRSNLYYPSGSTGQRHRCPDCSRNSRRLHRRLILCHRPR